MSLAARLREALARGDSASPALLAGDLREPPFPSEPHIPAAVLIPIVERPEPGLLLTLRTDTVSRHAGQVAFPGGRIDPDDEGPVAAALREAEEEIGLSPQSVEVVDVGDSYLTGTGFEVTPVIGVVPPDLRLLPQEGEVAAIFETPLAHLLDPAHQLVRTGEWRGRERSYYEIEWEDRRIWGITAALIVNLSRRLELVS